METSLHIQNKLPLSSKCLSKARHFIRNFSCLKWKQITLVWECHAPQRLTWQPSRMQCMVGGNSKAFSYLHNFLHGPIRLVRLTKILMSVWSESKVFYYYYSCWEKYCIATIALGECLVNYNACLKQFWTKQYSKTVVYLTFVGKNS